MEDIKKYELKRDVTKKECPWLDKDIPKGTVLFSYEGSTYGVISFSGVAVTLKSEELESFEVPKDAVTVIP